MPHFFMKKFKSFFQLPLGEYIAVVLFFGFIASLALYSYRMRDEPSDFKLSGEVWQSDIRILVSISGEVERPGKYVVKYGTKVKEALELAGIKPSGELSKLNLDKEIKKRMALRVPKVKKTVKKVVK